MGERNAIMPKDKDLKRRVRARMDKTGESYTTARSHLVRRKPPIPENYAELAGISDATVSAKTGRTWPEWVRTLDAIGAMEMQHRDIARWVRDETGLSWWSQSVTVGYERIRGLREVGQRRDGDYEANRSRTFAVPVAQLYRAFADARRRRKWLDVDVTVRRATPEKSVRMTWSDGTNVEVYVQSKGESKSSAAVQHGRLPTKDAAIAMKARWGEWLDVLKEQLEG